MTEAIMSPDIQPRREPYPIRGHHLWVYYELMKGIPPRELAEKVLKVSTTRPSFSFTETLRRKKDYTGSLWRKGKFVDNLTDEFTQFNALPDDFPVALKEQQQDHICNACAIGSHCPIKRDESFFAVFSDKNLLDRYLTEAKKRDFPITLTTETASFSNAPSEEVRVIGTTVGAVKEILQTAPGKFVLDV